MRKQAGWDSPGTVSNKPRTKHLLQSLLNFLFHTDPIVHFYLNFEVYIYLNSLTLTLAADFANQANNRACDLL